MLVISSKEHLVPTTLSKIAANSPVSAASLKSIARNNSFLLTVRILGDARIITEFKISRVSRTYLEASDEEG